MFLLFDSLLQCIDNLLFSPLMGHILDLFRHSYDDDNDNNNNNYNYNNNNNNNNGNNDFISTALFHTRHTQLR